MEIATLLDATGDVYYKLCMNAAILSFITTYILNYFVKKIKHLWLKVPIAAALYLVLFFVWQFVLIAISGNN